MQEFRPPPNLPIHCTEVPGYLRSRCSRCSSVLFNRSRSSSSRQKSALPRWFFHDVQGTVLEQLVKDKSITAQLARQLEHAVPQLQDKQLDSSFQPLAEPSTASAANQELTWLSDIEVVPVSASGPGHRAHNPQAASQLQAVAPKKDFAAGDLIGFYLGYVYDGDEYDEEFEFPDSNHSRFIYDFTITAPRGAIRVQPSSTSPQRQQGLAAPDAAAAGAAAAAAAGEPSQQQEDPFVQNFVVDASTCQDGNPLAHMLDYRALAADWPMGPKMFDQQQAVPGGANAAMLPVSDNSTGKVYVAVVALRSITTASGEDICIDYGLDYWRSRRSLDRMLQSARMEAGRRSTRELKVQLKQLADQLAQERTVSCQLAQSLQQLQHTAPSSVPAARRSQQHQLGTILAAAADELVAASDVALIAPDRCCKMAPSQHPDSPGAAAAADQLEETTSMQGASPVAPVAAQVGRRRKPGPTAGIQPALKRSRTAHSEQHQGTFDSFVQRLKSPSVSVQEAAARALCNLAYSSAADKAAIAAEPGCITALVPLLSSDSVGVQEAAAGALRNLACGSAANKAAIAAEPGCITAFVQLLSSDSVGVQQAAVGAMCHLACGSAANKAAIAAEPGCITAFVQLLSSDSVGVQEAAAGALRNLACGSAANKAAIAAEPGCITAFVQLLSSDSVGVQQAAVGAMCHLACSSAANKAAIAAKPGCITALVPLLSSDSVGVQEAAAGATRNLACGSAAIKAAIAAEPGCITALVQLLSSDSVGVQQAAARALCKLARGSAAIKAAIAAEPGCITALVQQLSSDSVGVQQAAARALCKLARGSAAIKAAIAAEPGCITALVKLLSSDSVGVQGAAADALGNLAWDSASQVAIAAESGCITALVQLLSSNSVGVLQAAAGALRSLADGSAANQATIAAKPGCIPALMLLSQSKSESVQEAAGWAIRSLKRGSAR